MSSGMPHEPEAKGQPELPGGPPPGSRPQGSPAGAWYRPPEPQAPAGHAPPQAGGHSQGAQRTAIIWPPLEERRRRWPSPRALGVVGLALLLVLVGAGVTRLLTARDTGGGVTEENRLLVGPPGASVAPQAFPLPAEFRNDGHDQDLRAVAAVGSTVVAVGVDFTANRMRPLFLVSTDAGRSWRIATLKASDGGDAPATDGNPQMVLGTAGAWLAMSSGVVRTVVWASQDGQQWTRLEDSASRAFDPSDRPQEVTRTASGYVAVGGFSPEPEGAFQPVVWTSRDGRAWERRPGAELGIRAGEGESLLLEHVAAAGNVVLAVGRAVGEERTQQLAWRSTDGGSTWASLALPRDEARNGDVADIVQTSNGFALLIAGTGEDGQRFHALMTSADGTQWSELGRFPDVTATGAGEGDAITTVQQLAWSPQGYAALASVGTSQYAILRSADGREWSYGSVQGLIEQGSNRIEGLAWAGGTVVAVGGRQEESEGGGNVDALVYLVGADGVPQEVELDGVPGLTATVALHFDDVTTADGLTVAVGGIVGDTAVWTSTDARTWAPAANPTPVFSSRNGQRLLSVAKGERGWVAVGLRSRIEEGETVGRPMVLVSEDATEWQVADNRAVFSAPEKEGGVRQSSAVAAGPDGYVVVGFDQPRSGPPSAVVWYSRDLVDWKEGRPDRPAPEGEPDDLKAADGALRGMLDVVALPDGGYVAVGRASDPASPPGVERPAVWTSEDGAAWSLEQLPLPGDATSARLDYAATSGGTVVALGTAQRVGDGGEVSTFPFAAVAAADGGDWELAELPAPPGSAPSALLATAGGYVAAGYTGPPGRGDVRLWTSSDGRAWNARDLEGVGLTGPGEQRITALTAVGSTLVGLGYTADYRNEFPTLWHTPLPR